MHSAPLYLDVRTEAEYAEAHVDPSRNIPLDALPGRLAELGPKDREIIVFCRSGRRSAQAAQLLRAAGYVNVRDVGSLERVRSS